jgi:hypothetical protein
MELSDLAGWQVLCTCARWKLTATRELGSNGAGSAAGSETEGGQIPTPPVSGARSVVSSFSAIVAAFLSDSGLTDFAASKSVCSTRIVCN